MRIEQEVYAVEIQRRDWPGRRFLDKRAFGFGEPRLHYYRRDAVAHKNVLLPERKARVVKVRVTYEWEA